MIYKIELGDITIIEIEACRFDKIISIHLKQGYDVKGEYKYKNYLNTSLNEETCKDLISALSIALSDLQKINTNSKNK